MALSGNSFRWYIYTMDSKIEDIKKIVTDADKLEVVFEKFFPNFDSLELTAYNQTKNEKVTCSLFDRKTLFYVATLAQHTDLVTTLSPIQADNIAITSDKEVYFKAGDKIVSSSCNIYKANMYISSGDTCEDKKKNATRSDSKALIVNPMQKKKNDDAIATEKPATEKPATEKPATDSKKAADEAEKDKTLATGNIYVENTLGGGNPNKIGSIYQSFCGLRVFDFEEKFKVFVMDRQQVVKIEFTDSIAYFSLENTSGTIKFNENTLYVRIYKDGKKEYGKYLTNETLIVTKEKNMKFGERDLTQEEANQISEILDNKLEHPNKQKPASSSNQAQSTWSTYALPVAATATAAAGLAYLYKKSKRKPKKSKSTRRTESSSSSSSSRRPVKSSRKRKH